MYIYLVGKDGRNILFGMVVGKLIIVEDVKIN